MRRRMGNFSSIKRGHKKLGRRVRQSLCSMAGNLCKLHGERKQTEGNGTAGKLKGREGTERGEVGISVWKYRGWSYRLAAKESRKRGKVLRSDKRAGAQQTGKKSTPFEVKPDQLNHKTHRVVCSYRSERRRNKTRLPGQERWGIHRPRKRAHGVAGHKRTRDWTSAEKLAGGN